MKIFANTLVKNEENFVWFALMSVVDYVDKILVWDMGSNDKTVSIIKEVQKLYPKKISFKEAGESDGLKFTRMRQEMIEDSDCDWILILDGDEVWWEDSIKRLVKQINRQPGKAGIAVPMTVAVGDIYHMQEERAGRYEILGRKGHLSLKAINRKIEGLHADNPYPGEGFFDGKNRKIQERDDIVFLDAPLLHATHLKRSSSSDRENKYKHELGKEVTAGFKFPEVFYLQRPTIVKTPWVKVSGSDLIKARFLTPLRKIKRRILF